MTEPSTTEEARPAPPSLEFDEAAIPRELAELDHWMLWAPVWNPPAKGKPGRWTKPPLNPDAPAWALKEDNPEARKAGRMGSSTDSSKWTDLSYAVARARKLRLGLGFGLSEEVGLVGVDIDHCVAEGQIKPWAQAIVDVLDTYTEVSPSGTGIRVFAFGTIPKALKISTIGLELYSTGRYLTVTGRRLPESPSHVRHCEPEVQALYEQFAEGFSREQSRRTNSRRSPIPATGSDQEVIDRILRSRQGERFRRLYAGDAAGYASHSEADFALASILCWWCDNDASQVESIMRSSGLNREKWDTSRPGGTYLSTTIGNAIQRQSEPRASPLRAAKLDGEVIRGLQARRSARRNQSSPVDNRPGKRINNSPCESEDPG